MKGILKLKSQFSVAFSSLDEEVAKGHTFVNNLLFSQNTHFLASTDDTIADFATRNQRLLSALEGNLKLLCDFGLASYTVRDIRWEMFTQFRLDVVYQLINNIMIHQTDALGFGHA